MNEKLSDIDHLVSIVMPAYNSGEYIAESIQSVFSQTYQNWELLVVDDGSTDNTADIVKDFSTRDNRVRYFYQKNSGQHIARNFAIKAANGDLIAFLDSDDIWFSDKLEISICEFDSYDQDLFFTGVYKFCHLSDLKDPSTLELMTVTDSVYKGQEALNIFVAGNRVPILATLAKRDVLLEAGGFPPIRIAEDYYLWLKLLFKGCVFRSISQPLTAYRLRENSLMSETPNESKEVLDMFILLSEDYPELRTNYRRQIKHWIRQFIKFRLNKDNIGVLEMYFSYFNQYTVLTRFVFLFKNVLTLSSFKKLLKSVL